MKTNIYLILVLILSFFTSNLIYAEGEIDYNNPQSYYDSSIYSNPQTYADPNFWKNVPIEQINNIPPEQFDPNKLSVEKLKAATEVQIANNLGKFTNLADANPVEVTKVFSNNFNVNIDISSATNIKFDSNTGKISGDFPSYDPKQYPKDKFQQIILGDSVKIIPINLNKENMGEIIIKGADSFSVNTDGSLLLQVQNGKTASINGNQKGTIIMQEGTIILFSNLNSRGKFSIDSSGNFQGENAIVEIKNSEKTLIRIEGKFEKKSDVYNIYSYSGKQSKFEDFTSNIKIQTTGYPLSISNNEKYVDKNKNYVVYNTNGDIKAHGQFSLNKNDLKVNSKDTEFLFNLKSGKISSTGVGEIENNNFKYSGLNKNTQFSWSLNGKTEDIRIIGGEKNKDIAKFEKKMEVGYFRGWGIKKDTPLIFLVKDVNGEQIIDKTIFENGLKKFVSVKNGVVSPEFWITSNNNNFNLNVGNKNSINLDIAGSTKFKLNEKSTIEYVSPENILNIFGEKKDTKGNLLIQTILSGGNNIKASLGLDTELSLTQRALIAFYNFKEGNYFSFNDKNEKIEQGSLKKDTRISFVVVDNRYVFEEVMRNPVRGAELMESTDNLNSNKENILVATGHHVGKDGLISGIGDDFQYKDIPKEINMVLFSACETIPPYDNLKIDYSGKQKKYIEDFLNQFPQKTTLIGGYLGMNENGDKGVKAPIYDDNIPYALSEEMLKLKEENPEKYIQNMIKISRDNSLKRGGLSGAVCGVVSGICREQYQMSFYYKKSDGSWYYYDKKNINGVKVK